MITHMNAKKDTNPVTPSSLKTWIALALAGVLTAWTILQLI
jgi:hypothetical protein